VHFYGAVFREGDVWICMEVMECSLDKFYPIVFGNNQKIPEGENKYAEFPCDVDQQISGF
jgi:hypothetical protein